MKKYKMVVDEYFKLGKILYGQCFRWKMREDGKYIGVINNNVIKIWQEGNFVYFYAMDNKNIEEFIHEYFDMGTNYKKIVQGIKKNSNNELLNEIIKYSKGTRILNQSMFEILISYIFSASNNIPRIENSIERLSQLYGNKLEFENNIYYSFPTKQQLKSVSSDEYKQKIRIGYRAPYVENTVKDILSGNYDLEDISKMDTNLARNKLLNLQGVGPKVADCILLFSMKKKDVFPIDTWIEKVMKKYFNNENLTKKQIQELIDKEFGEYKGIINHYMFYWGRENKI